MLGVSRWTISRRVKQYGLESLQGFSDISDEELDSLVKELLERQGRTMGQVFIGGYLKSKGLWVQRSRVRDCLLGLTQTTEFCVGVSLSLDECIMCHGQILCGIWMGITP